MYNNIVFHPKKRKKGKKMKGRKKGRRKEKGERECYPY
jgi:hypothetical protein